MNVTVVFVSFLISPAIFESMQFRSRNNIMIEIEVAIGECPLRSEFRACPLAVGCIVPISRLFSWPSSPPRLLQLDLSQVRVTVRGTQTHWPPPIFQNPSGSAFPISWREVSVEQRGARLAVQPSASFRIVKTAPPPWSIRGYKQNGIVPGISVDRVCGRPAEKSYGLSRFRGKETRFELRGEKSFSYPYKCSITDNLLLQEHWWYFWAKNRQTILARIFVYRGNRTLSQTHKVPVQTLCQTLSSV